MKLRVGIIGAGRMGKFHLDFLEKMEEAEIVAICDIRKNCAEDLAHRVKARVYTNYQKMYDEEELDCVFICTPAHARERQLEEAAIRGIHIFVEKPAALTLQQGEKTYKVIEKSGVICSVGFLWRYSEGVEKVRNFLKDKKVALIDARWYHTIPPVAWVRSKEKGGGQIVDQSIHLIDLMRYLVGEIQEVYGKATRGLFPEISDFTADDASAVTLTFKDKTVANRSSTYSLFSGAPLGPEINIIGKRMLVKINSDKVEVYTPYEEEFKFDEKAHLAHMMKSPKANIEQFDIQLTNAAMKEDEIFLKAVISNNSSIIRCDFSDALETLKVALAIERSIHLGKPVSL